MDQISGGYLYNRYLVEHLRSLRLDVVYHPCIDDVTDANDEDVLIVDGLALPESGAQLLTSRAHVVLLLHMLPEPERLGPGGDQDLRALIRRSRVVVTGDTALAEWRDYTAYQGVDTTKIEPGVPGHWKEKERYSDRARSLLGIANYIPGKGVRGLIEALAQLRHLPWRLTVHGNTAFDPEHHSSLCRMVERIGLHDRIQLLGPVPHDEINKKMVEADLLVHFSEHESYSMVTAEAIACGLPVLSHRNGNADSFLRSGLVRHVSSTGAVKALEGLIKRPHEYASLRRAERPRRRTWGDVGNEFAAWLSS